MNKKNITITTADDHPISLRGLNDELEQAGYIVTGSAVNGVKALDLIATLKPTIAFVDIEMPLLNGFEVIKRGLKISPETRFITMSYHKKKGFVVQAKKVGAHGYLLKEDDIIEIELCIKTILEDENYFSSAFNDNYDKVVEREFKKFRLLTPSERTIIRLVAQGNNSNQIGEVLCISNRTVQKHRSNIISKLELEPSSDSLTQWTNEYGEIISSL